MTQNSEFNKNEAEILKLIEEKFSIQKGSLGGRMRRIGRRLPKRAHAAVEVLRKAQSLAGHPTLSRQVDARAVDKAFATLRETLNAIDPADRRKGAILGTLGSLSFNLLVLLALLVFLAWRGLA